MGVLVTNNLSKKYNKLSINNLNFEILDGEFFALLGTEKSGIDILPKLIFNFAKVSKSGLTVFDLDPSRDSKEVKHYCSYGPLEIYFSSNPKAMTVFKNTLKAHNLQTREELEFLLDYFDFNASRRVADLEGKDKRLFSIINALIAKPRLAVLEEPTKDLDKETIAKLFSYLETKRSEEGLSLLVLGQDFENSQRYCDRVGIVENGSLKEIVYVKDKRSNDKILRIYNDDVELSIFENIGAVLIGKDKDYREFYYEKNPADLVEIIHKLGIVDFTIEDASLTHKLQSLNSKKGDDEEWQFLVKNSRVL